MFQKQLRGGTDDLFRLEGDVEYNAQLVPCTDMRYICGMSYWQNVIKRALTEKIDTEIRTRYLKKACALTFHLDIDNAERVLGAQERTYHSMKCCNY